MRSYSDRRENIYAESENIKEMILDTVLDITRETGLGLNAREYRRPIAVFHAADFCLMENMDEAETCNFSILRMIFYCRYVAF